MKRSGGTQETVFVGWCQVHGSLELYVVHVYFEMFDMLNLVSEGDNGVFKEWLLKKLII